MYWSQTILFSSVSGNKYQVKSIITAYYHTSKCIQNPALSNIRWNSEQDGCMAQSLFCAGSTCSERPCISLREPPYTKCSLCHSDQDWLFQSHLISNRTLKWVHSCLSAVTPTSKKKTCER